MFNSAETIEKCDDKGRTYIELDGIVPQPKTLIAPKCYFKSDMSEFVEKAIDILTLPLIFKESFGSFGAQVFLCNTKEEIYSPHKRKAVYSAKIYHRQQGSRQKN